MSAVLFYRLSYRLFGVFHQTPVCTCAYYPQADPQTNHGTTFFSPYTPLRIRKMAQRVPISGPRLPLQLD
jgi:hypothetical protein